MEKRYELKMEGDMDSLQIAYAVTQSLAFAQFEIEEGIYKRLPKKTREMFTLIDNKQS